MSLRERQNANIKQFEKVFFLDGIYICRYIRILWNMFKTGKVKKFTPIALKLVGTQFTKKKDNSWTVLPFLLKGNKLAFVEVTFIKNGNKNHDFSKATDLLYRVSLGINYVVKRLLIPPKTRDIAVFNYCLLKVSVRNVKAITIIGEHLLRSFFGINHSKKYVFGVNIHMNFVSFFHIDRVHSVQNVSKERDKNIVTEPHPKSKDKVRISTVDIVLLKQFDEYNSKVTFDSYKLKLAFTGTEQNDVCWEMLTKLSQWANSKHSTQKLQELADRVRKFEFGNYFYDITTSKLYELEKEIKHKKFVKMLDGYVHLVGNVDKSTDVTGVFNFLKKKAGKIKFFVFDGKTMYMWSSSQKGKKLSFEEKVRLGLLLDRFIDNLQSQNSRFNVLRKIRGFLSSELVDSLLVMANIILNGDTVKWKRVFENNQQKLKTVIINFSRMQVQSTLEKRHLMALNRKFNLSQLHLREISYNFVYSPIAMTLSKSETDVETLFVLNKFIRNEEFKKSLERSTSNIELFTNLKKIINNDSSLKRLHLDSSIIGAWIVTNMANAYYGKFLYLKNYNPSEDSFEYYYKLAYVGFLKSLEKSKQPYLPYKYDSVGNYITQQMEKYKGGTGLPGVFDIVKKYTDVINNSTTTGKAILNSMIFFESIDPQSILPDIDQMQRLTKSGKIQIENPDVELTATVQKFQKDSDDDPIFVLNNVNGSNIGYFNYILKEKIKETRKFLEPILGNKCVLYDQSIYSSIYFMSKVYGLIKLESGLNWFRISNVKDVNTELLIQIYFLYHKEYMKTVDFEKYASFEDKRLQKEKEVDEIFKVGEEGVLLGLDKMDISGALDEKDFMTDDQNIKFQPKDYQFPTIKKKKKKKKKNCG